MSNNTQRNLKVVLLRHTPNPEEAIALGAKLCYSKAQIDDLRLKVEAKDQTTFIEKLMNMGHESVLEHATFTFGIEGVSRVLLAQITRHRIGASFSVQSQRYVSYKEGFGYIVPPAIEKLGPRYVEQFQKQMATLQKWYEEWQQLLGDAGEKSNEDARFILPNATETRMLVTMNVRELRHFFQLRMCSRAQWEIRALATEMHRQCMIVAPALFADAGPACLRGKCPEGEKTCGRAAEIRAEREAFVQTLKEHQPTTVEEMRQIKTGDIFFLGDKAHLASTDAHPSGDASYTGYIVYDESGNAWFEEDFAGAAVPEREEETVHD